jgi:hypothetical protein
MRKSDFIASFAMNAFPLRARFVVLCFTTTTNNNNNKLHFVLNVGPRNHSAPRFSALSFSTLISVILLRHYDGGILIADCERHRTLCSLFEAILRPGTTPSYACMHT